MLHYKEYDMFNLLLTHLGTTYKTQTDLTVSVYVVIY